VLNQALAELLATKRPDSDTWAGVVKLLGSHTTPAETATIKSALAKWPKEVPRPAPKAWIQQRYVGNTSQRSIYFDLLDRLCLDVKEDEQLYHHYITEICGSPRLRLRNGSPAVNLWRQPRGVVTLQSGGQVTLGAGQPGLADVGGTVTVEWGGGDGGCACGLVVDSTTEVRCTKCRYVAQPPYRTNLYIEVEVKIDQKIPPLAREYRGTSKRVLTQTEQDQCQRQQAQLARGGCYIFAERVAEAIDELVRYRDEVLARM
jgi:hypothetical protein